MIGVRNWYQTPPFFVLMVPVVAGFIQALVIALMPDDRFDARFNASAARTESKRLGRGAGGNRYVDGRGRDR